ncbi:heparinase II/III family protein [bacterium]|nr:heparinase II/III family protein [bacterium]
MRYIYLTLYIITACILFSDTPAAQTVAGKTHSVLYTADMVRKARLNAEKYPWAAEIKNSIVSAAQPWMKYSDDELWNMMFGNTISRSWMVWSDGYCPACHKDVRMYSWKVDALGMPWKVQCPHCGAIFPTNDFYAFYRSGLDEHGVFMPARADRKLLFNAEHPDPADSLHLFGVDDGEGYVEGTKRWRFIGAYLIYGQWKQAIVAGIRDLAEAYTVTGDKAYAHKAGILLDRVADLYGTFDFGKEGLVYERKGATGYVSTWHDACVEHYQIVIAYDQVFEALRDDRELVAFLSGKAKAYGLSNPKTSFGLIQDNIENGILRDAITNRHKINSNYPATEVSLAVTHTVLGWPENRGEVYAIIDTMAENSSGVDGLSGEKGLASYSSYPINILAHFFEMFARMDSTFLPDIVERHPNLRKTWRFHIDTWFNGEYYPLSGDTGGFAQKVTSYPTARTTRSPGVDTSMFSFLRDLYVLTGDPAYVQVLYRENGNSVDNLPWDLFADDPEEFQKTVADVIKTKGTTIEVGSVNKEQWCLAIMRSGRGENARAFWLDYDTGERHSHIDGMNLGLFAKRLDLLPEMGYPPVQYGGWESQRALWVRRTAAHNTVVVDGKDQDNPRTRHIGRTTLWADGNRFRAIRASAPEFYGIEQYERTVALVDISDEDSYLIDIFRVVGGTDHAKFMQSHFGSIATKGLSLKPAADYGHDTIMRNFRVDGSPAPGWEVDWKVEDRLGYLPNGSDIHVRYCDLTEGAQAYTAEGWITVSSYNENQELWIPRIMVRRQAEKAPLVSTFISLIEPYGKSSNILRIRRLPLVTENGKPYPDTNAAVEISLADGHRDVFVAADVENPLKLAPSRASDRILAVREPSILFDGELCHVRYDRNGKVTYVALYGGKSLRAGELELSLTKESGFFEISIEGAGAKVLAGDSAALGFIKVGGKALPIQ